VAPFSNSIVQEQSSSRSSRGSGPSGAQVTLAVIHGTGLGIVFLSPELGQLYPLVRPVL
jgi:hypothetical protein